MDKKRSESAAPASRFKVEEENLEVKPERRKEESGDWGLAMPFHWWG